MSFGETKRTNLNSKRNIGRKKEQFGAERRQLC